MNSPGAFTRRDSQLTDEQRAQLAQPLDIRLDPVGASDKALIVIGFALQGLTGVLVILALISRKYKPIMAKNLPLIALVYISAVLYFTSGISTNGLARVTGTWSKCRLWGLWIRIPSVYFFTCFLIIRVAVLHRLFIVKKPYKGWVRILPYTVVVVPLVIFNIVAQLSFPESTISYMPLLEVCVWNNAFQFALLGITCVICTLFSVYMVLIRNIRSSFNEFRESLVIYIVGMAAVVETVVVHAVLPYFPLHRNARIIVTVFDLVGTLNPIWILLGYPVYMCYFSHDRYLEAWLSKLSADGLRKEYAVSDPPAPAESTLHLMEAAHSLKYAGQAEHSGQGSGQGSGQNAHSTVRIL